MNITVKKHKESSQEIFENIYPGAKKIVYLLMPTSLYTAIVGTSIISLSFLLLGITPVWEMAFAVFLITFSTYSLNKLTDKEEDLINIPERASLINAK